MSGKTSNGVYSHFTCQKMHTFRAGWWGVAHCCCAVWWTLNAILPLACQ